MADNPRQRLGKGLEALIPTTSDNDGAGERTEKVIPEAVFAAGRTVVNVPITDILPNPQQPRTQIEPESLQDLADSIRAQGIIQPILVQRQGDKYELVAGERRWRAAGMAGLAMIPAIIKNFSPEQSLEIALIENLQREDLNPMDEAEAYHQLATEFKLTQEVISQKVGKRRSTIANAVRLLELPEDIRQGLRLGRVSAGHVRPLLSLDGPDEQLRVYREMLEQKLNVREAEQLVATERRVPVTTRRRIMSVHPDLLDILNTLLDYFGTKIKISGTPRRGRIMLEYYSEEDLERLVDLMVGKRVAQAAGKPPVAEGQEDEDLGDESTDDAANTLTPEELHSLVDNP